MAEAWLLAAACVASGVALSQVCAAVSRSASGCGDARVSCCCGLLRYDGPAPRAASEDPDEPDFDDGARESLIRCRAAA